MTRLFSHRKHRPNSLGSAATGYLQEQTDAPQPKPTIEDDFYKLFRTLEAGLFREATEREQAWLSDNGLSTEMRVALTTSRAQKANIELKQRASSFIYAIFLMAKSKNAQEQYQKDLSACLF